MIWYSIGLSDGWVITAWDMKSLYYQMIHHMRFYVGDTMKGDYKTIFGTFRQHTYLNNLVSDMDIGFTMMTSCTFTVCYYGSMNQITIGRGILK